MDDENEKSCYSCRHFIKGVCAYAFMEPDPEVKEKGCSAWDQ